MFPPASPYRIETPRLLIRAWQPEDRVEDRAAFARFVGDADMMRFITGSQAWTQQQIDGFFARQAAHLRTSGMCMGAMVLRASGEVIGVAGVQPLDGDYAHDIGWWVWKGYWRQGYAREAAASIRDHAFRQHGLGVLHAVIDPDNHASQAVATRIGMHLIGRTTADRTGSWRPAVEVLVYEVRP